MKNSKIYFQNRKEVIKMKKKLLILLLILGTMSTLEGKTDNKKDCLYSKRRAGMCNGYVHTGGNEKSYGNWNKKG